LKLPPQNTSVAKTVDTEHCQISPGDWLQCTCFEGSLTPLSSESDHDGIAPSFDTSNVMDIQLDHGAYTPRSWLKHTCFEGSLTPLSSEGDSFDSSFESGSSDVGQLPPPALTREETCETFDGLLTPHGSMDMGEAGSELSRSVASASGISPTSKGKTNTNKMPVASMFDAAHACGWFPDPPPLAETEIVVSNFGELSDVFQFPPSVWRLEDKCLVRDYDVTFESPSLPIAGDVPVTCIVEREMRALERGREEVMRVLESERMSGIDSDEDAEEDDFESLEDPYSLKPKTLGPEGTEIYDNVIAFPEGWASRRSMGLSRHPTEELVE